MVNGAFEFSARAGNLGFEPGDATLQLGDGKRIEILAAERGDGIVASLGQEFVGVHISKVDRKSSAVNKADAPFCSDRVKSWSACNVRSWVKFPRR